MNGLFDCHVHSEISADCTAPMADMIRAGHAAGLSGMVFTEHVDFGFPVPNVEHADLARYLALYDKCRNCCPGFPVLRGIELGYIAGYEADNAAYLAALNPDQVILSVHAMDGYDLYNAKTYPEGHQHEIYGRYLQRVYESIDGFPDFDVLGHIGFVAKKSPYPDGGVHYAEFPDEIDAILKHLIERGHALELNTSGYGIIGTPLPEAAVFKRYRELGGKLVTIGSDSHHPERVALAFDTARELLLSLGFHYETHYEGRCAVNLPL